MRQAVALARPAAGDGGQQLVGYVIADAAVAPAALRARLAGELPEHMVPGAIVVLDAFPIADGPNGPKVQRARRRPASRLPRSPRRR